MLCLSGPQPAPLEMLDTTGKTGCKTPARSGLTCTPYKTRNHTKGLPTGGSGAHQTSVLWSPTRAQRGCAPDHTLTALVMRDHRPHTHSSVIGTRGSHTVVDVSITGGFGKS